MRREKINSAQRVQGRGNKPKINRFSSLEFSDKKRYTNPRYMELKRRETDLVQIKNASMLAFCDKTSSVNLDEKNARQTVFHFLLLAPSLGACIILPSSPLSNTAKKI